MSNRLRLYILIGCLLSIFSLNAMAKMDIILSLNAPPDRDYFMPPGGYVRCFMIPSEFHHDSWINSHRVCEYQGRRGSALWVSGYWMCDRIKHHNKCKHWDWVPSHWEGRPTGNMAYAGSRPDMMPPPPPVQVIVQPASPPPPDHHHHHG